MSAALPLRTLFVCIHNSARSQMAEAFVNLLGGGRVVAESAGLEPGRLNPVVVQAMREVGIDISENTTKSVDEMLRGGHLHECRFDIVVTVCDDASAERCPAFPGLIQRMHWPFPDPGAAVGTPEAQLAVAREVRDAIRASVTAWLAEAETGFPAGITLKSPLPVQTDRLREVVRPLA